MMVLISYDVTTESEGGKRRLRRVARACRDYGQRVQHSVFECEVEPAQWVKLKARLLKEIDPSRTACASTTWVPTGSGAWSTSAPSRRSTWMDPWSLKRANRKRPVAPGTFALSAFRSQRSARLAFRRRGARRPALRADRRSGFALRRGFLFFDIVLISTVARSHAGAD